ncbi:serum response factor-binding protein 1 isoform X1 [Falco biarmicus]|uniref:serum response factor-binding protein 1 isoform X1 n=2 Tax=Falco TaxID=8952 RepID=UPI00067946B4|nr:serum response factor-binding protein 1 isoform X1 [Falco peregrinus]XP_014139338.1 serum response factor-binding protein 1 isoform X1 [Falco cherrug]XP_056181049.1 serum response factor-binding protein 1 isoform X1 [Falco biarmicus]
MCASARRPVIEYISSSYHVVSYCLCVSTEVLQVVKMRKDVKKARVLTIRRLTRHIGKLKLKKGSEDLKLKNQKRVERLIEEIHAMKEIKPDEVTRMALRTEVNFETVCRKPNCTATERAIARLATHPILKSRFVELKAAVKAFKDARKNPDKATPSKKAKSEEQPKSAHFNRNLDDQALKQAQNQQGCEQKTKISMKIETDSVGEELCESESEQKNVKMKTAYATEESSFQAVEMQAGSQSKTGKKLNFQKRKENMSMNKFSAIKEKNNDDSDQEHPNEEEYFDDSTEERFYNQSSDSDSDSSDDFFIGKVKRKKKIAAVTDPSSAKEKDSLQKNMLKKGKNTAPGTVQDLIMEKGKPHAKPSKLESMFCSSLSTSDQKSQNRRRNSKDQPLKNGRTALLKKEPHLKKQPFAKATSIKCDNKKACSEQPLHPSWEASRRRREQMSQITAFQGKKIKFDD